MSPAPCQLHWGKSLIEFLNNIINGSLIYDIKRFNEAKLRSKTEHLLKDNPKGEALVYLNRILLEDAYPLEIIKTPESANPKTANCLYLTPEDDEPLNALLEESREEANRELIENEECIGKDQERRGTVA